MENFNRRELLKMAIGAGAGAILHGDERIPAEGEHFETRILNEKELHEYIKDKRIIACGEDHNPEERVSSEVFSRLVPILRGNSFTHIGLELDQERHQESIDTYMREGQEEAITKEIGKYMNGEKLLTIIRAIRSTPKPFMKIVCFDDRQSSHYTVAEKEDRQVWWAAREQKRFDAIEKILAMPSTKIALYDGFGHVSNRQIETFQNGTDVSGMPILIQLRNPLGYRLKQKYGRKDVGLIDLAGHSNKNTTDVRVQYDRPLDR